MRPAVRQALEAVEEIAGRAYSYGAPVLYEEDVIELDAALTKLRDELAEPEPAPRELTERDRFYAEHQKCGHGQVVWFGKGDWFHLSDGSICTKEPTAPKP